MPRLNPVCKVCGVTLCYMFDPPPDICDRCNPRYPRVTLPVLERLNSVPSAYRKLVEMEILHDLTPCGDVEFLFADALFGAREHFDAVASNPHLQPFAQTAGGDLWCWTSFRTGHSIEPEILQVCDWRVVVYAPTFQTFLFRSALEDASGRWDVDSDELPQRIRHMAKILRVVESHELAADLESISREPIADRTPEVVRRHGYQWLGLVNESDARQKIDQRLGGEYLDSKHGCEFLQSGKYAI